MSTLAYPIGLTSVIQSEVDFVDPVFLVKEGGSLKSFNINIPNSFSESSITTKLEVSNTQMLVEKLILHEQLVDVNITGTTSTGINILQSGCQSARPHALARSYNQVTAQFGNASYTFNCADLVSALEHYNPQVDSKYHSDIDLSYLDQSQSYDSLLGSNRNPLQLYSTGLDSQVHRGTQPFYNIVNTPTTASFRTTFREYIPVTPLSDQILRMGSGFALSHLNNINLTFNLVPNLFSRMFSFMKTRNGDVLTITSATVTIRQPIFRFVQISDAYNRIPPVITYPLMTMERYPTDFTFPSALTLPAQNLLEMPSQVIQTSRIPEWIMLFARPSNNVLNNGNGAGLVGAQIPDCFAGINKLNILFNGETLFTNTDVSSLYKMSSENGLVDSFWQFSGLPILSECSSANGSYIIGSGSVVKLMINKDLCLQNARVAPGTAFRTNIQAIVTFAQVNPDILNYTLYMVLGYPDTIQMYGDNLSTINNAAITMADVESVHKANNHVHYDELRNENIGGAGLFNKSSSILSNGAKIMDFIRKGKCAAPIVHRAYNELVKNCGNGAFSGGAPSGGAPSGGAMASKGMMKHNLLR